MILIKREDGEVLNVSNARVLKTIDWGMEQGVEFRFSEPKTERYCCYILPGYTVEKFFEKIKGYFGSYMFFAEWERI